MLRSLFSGLKPNFLSISDNSFKDRDKQVQDKTSLWTHFGHCVTWHLSSPGSPAPCTGPGNSWWEHHHGSRASWMWQWLGAGRRPTDERSMDSMVRLETTVTKRVKHMKYFCLIQIHWLYNQFCVTKFIQTSVQEIWITIFITFNICCCSYVDSAIMSKLFLKNALWF